MIHEAVYKRNKPDRKVLAYTGLIFTECLTPKLFYVAKYRLYRLVFVYWIEIASLFPLRFSKGNLFW